MAEIGTIRQSDREINPGTPNPPSSAFGAGVAQALGSMAQTMQTAALAGADLQTAQDTVNLAYKQRQDRITKANLNVEFLKLTNDLRLETQEDYNNAPLGAAGFTDQTKGKVDTAYNDFLAKVPEDMRPDFVSLIEQQKIDITNTAFSLQTDAENKKYVGQLTDLQNDAVNQIMGAVIPPGSNSEDVLTGIENNIAATFDEMLANSPLDAQSTKDLRDKLVVTIKSAKLARVAQDDALGFSSNGGEIPQGVKQTGERIHSDGPVAAGLSPVAVGLLKAIAGPESGGDYNVLYSPGERTYFSDMSQHPNVSTRIPDGLHEGETSTAAGKYQDLKSTWDYIQQNLGLPDFGPESQDRGNWWYAGDVYSRATGGRNLEMVLMSGNGPAIIQAKRILEGTWTGLKNLSDQEFVATVTGSSGNPSTLITDPEYSIIPFDARVAIIQDASAKAGQIQAQMIADANAQKTAAMDNLLKGLSDGSMTPIDSMNFRKQYGTTYEEDQKIDKVYQEHNAQAFAATQFLTNTQDPNFVVDTEEDKKQAAAFIEAGGVVQALENQDTNYVDTALVPMITKTNYIPPNLVSALTSMASNRDPQAATFAMDTLSKLRAQQPNEFDRAFGNDMALNTSLYNAAKGSISENDLLAYIRNQNDPAMRALNDARREIVKKQLSDSPETFAPKNIASEMGLSAEPSMLTGQALFSEFWPVYNYMFAATGDQSKAMAAASDALKSRWGEFNVAGEMQVMRYPPSITAKPFEGSHDYVTEQLYRDFNFDQGQNYQLISDGMTEAQYLSGGKASYKLAKLDDNGMVVKILTWADTAGYDPKTDHEIGNQVMRWYPEISSDMVNKQIERTMIKTEIQKTSNQMWDQPINRYSGDPNEDYFMLAHKQEVLQQQLELGGKDFYKKPDFFGPLIRGIAPMRGTEVSDVIESLKSFKAETPEEYKKKLLEVDKQIDKMYPVFQRWEVRMRIQNLLKGFE